MKKRKQWKQYLSAGLAALLVVESVPVSGPLKLVSFAEMKSSLSSPSDATVSDATELDAEDDEVFEEELENDIVEEISSEHEIMLMSESADYDPDFGKLITNVKILHAEDEAVMTQANPLELNESAIFRFYYQLTDEMQSVLENVDDVELEYQLPDSIIQLTESYDDKIGTWLYYEEAGEPAYEAEYLENGLLDILLYTRNSEVYDGEYYFDVWVDIDAETALNVENVEIELGTGESLSVETYIEKLELEYEVEGTDIILKYKILGDTEKYVEIIDYDGGYEEDLIIPEKIDGISVTSIGEGAFSFGYFSSIVLPDTIDTIKTEAFWCCGEIENINIPASVEIIGQSAFGGCDKLENVVIPDSVHTIEAEAFQDCNALTEITLPKNLITIGDSAFADCSALTEIDIPDSVENIGTYCFARCTSVKTIVIGENVVNIGSMAFGEEKTVKKVVWNAKNAQDVETGIFQSKGLFDVVFGEAVEYVPAYSFACTTYSGINTITFSDSIKEIGAHAFEANRELTAVSIPDSVTDIGASAFADCTSLATVSLPDGIGQLENEIFANCSDLMSITIPESVSYIGYNAFYNCSNLKEIRIPDSVASIGTLAFKNCTSINTIEWDAVCVEDFEYNADIFAGVGTDTDGVELIFGENVKHIPAYLLYNSESESSSADSAETASKVNSVVFSDGILEIGESAFENCSLITDVVLQQGLLKVGDSAFSKCSNLKTVTIPITVEYIGAFAFYKCSGLENVVIPESMIELGRGAFQECTNLFEVEINNGIEILEDFTFMNCSSLENVTIPASVIEIGSELFKGCSALESVNISGGVKGIPSLSFAYCSNLLKVYLPSTVTLISEYAFKDCSALADVYFDGYEDEWNAVTGHKYVEYATIHYKDGVDTEENEEIKKSVYFLIGYAIEDNRLYLNDLLGLGFAITEETDTTFIDAIDDWMEKYICVTTKTSEDEGETSDILVSVTLLENAEGIITEIDEESITINSTKYSVDSDVLLSNLYVGKNVKYYYLDGCIFKVEVLPETSSCIYYLTEYEMSDSCLYLNNNLEQGFVFTESTDRSFIAEIDSWIGQYVYLKVQKDDDSENSRLISIRLVEVSEGRVTSVGESDITIDSTCYSTDSSVLLSNLYIGKKIRYYLLDECIVKIEVIDTITRRNGTFSYLSYDNKIREYDYTYDESWFFNSSYEYQHDLTRMSLRAAMAAGDLRTADDPKEDGAESIKKLMADLGFEYSEEYSHYPIPEYNSIGYAIGSKEIESSNGEKSTLIMIAVRGFGYGTEWGGNFNVGEGLDHAGFRVAADQVFQGLENYIADNEALFHSRIKVWISGYSRAAATTNFVAADLVDGFIDNIKPEDVFAFCFECPQNTTNNQVLRIEYENIVNIVNPIDLVTKVAMSQWGFSRFGNIYYLPAAETFSQYSNMKEAMEEECANIISYVTDDKSKAKVLSKITKEVSGQASALDDLMDDIAVMAISPSYYTKYYQDDVIVTIGDLGGGNVKIEDLGEITKGGMGLLGLIYPALCNYTVVDKQNLLAMKFNSHYPELCLAWLDSLEEMSTDSYVKTSEEFRKVFINCPVTVSVYDSKAQLVAQIIEDAITEIEGGVPAYIDPNGQKIVALPLDEEYTIQLTATDEGTVTYTVTEYNMNLGGPQRIVSYYEVPVSNGDQLSGIIENLNEIDVAEYPLILQDESIMQPSIEIKGDEIVSYDVRVDATEGGTVVGGGSFDVGEYAKVVATADDGYDFIGWYTNSEQVSMDAEYRFLIENDIEIEAWFGKIVDENPSEGDDEIDDGDNDSQEDASSDENNSSTDSSASDSNSSSTGSSSSGSGSSSTGSSSSSSGSSSGGGGGGGSSTRKATSTTGGGPLPSYVVKGTWSQTETDHWTFTDTNGIMYRNTWAAVYNPYANTALGQSNFDWFYFDANGFMVTGWLMDDGKRYYLNPESDGTKGKMFTGWHQVDGKWYYFNEISDGTKGAMLADTWVGEYYVNPEGVWMSDIAN